MTAVVEPVESRGPMQRVWPAWAVPPRAVGEWLELQAALQALAGPPLCSDDPGRWFSTVLEDVADAVAVCALCPVRAECAAYAIAADEKHGTFGGVTELERRQLAGRRR